MELAHSLEVVLLRFLRQLRDSHVSHFGVNHAMNALSIDHHSHANACAHCDVSYVVINITMVTML